jgi:hypothetical protein
MTEENQDQSFEDAFNELADAPSSEIEDDLPEEEFEDEQLQEGQEEEGLREVGSDDESEVEDDSVEAQLQRAREEAQLWQHKYNSDLGRQNAFQRKLAEQQQYIDQLQNQMKRSSPESMTPNEWKAIQEDYPEIAQGFQAYVGELEQRHRAEIESVRSALQPIQQQAEESYVMDQFRLLENEHPDYREIAQSDSFKSWVRQQPANVQDMYESKQAADAAYLLRSYKNDLMPGVQASSELKQRREKQLRQAQTVPQRGGRTRSNMPPEDDFEAAFDYFASKQ